MFENKEAVETTLSALGEQLQSFGSQPLDILVCGGSALQVLGLVDRATKDIDALAMIERQEQGLAAHRADPFPSILTQAIQKVARDFKLPEKWLNSGPTSAVEFGLPDGILNRAIVKEYGDCLTIRFINRLDQIHFKIFAATDQLGAGQSRHYADLLALQPTAQELKQAARWTMTHDPSEGYKGELKKILIKLGHKDVAEGI